MKNLIQGIHAIITWRSRELNNDEWKEVFVFAIIICQLQELV